MLLFKFQYVSKCLDKTRILWPVKMVQLANTLNIKPDDLSWSPGNHMVEPRNDSFKLPSDHPNTMPFIALYNNITRKFRSSIPEKQTSLSLNTRK